MLTLVFFHSPYQIPGYPQITINPPSILCSLSYSFPGSTVPSPLITLPGMRLPCSFLPTSPYYLSKPLCPLISCSSTGRIWLDNLSCSGTERSVTECASRGWGNSDCTHDEDAGVICKDERLPGFSDSNVIEVCSS